MANLNNKKILEAECLEQGSRYSPVPPTKGGDLTELANKADREKAAKRRAAAVESATNEVVEILARQARKGEHSAIIKRKEVGKNAKKVFNSKEFEESLKKRKLRFLKGPDEIYFVW